MCVHACVCVCVFHMYVYMCIYAYICIFIYMHNGTAEAARKEVENELTKVCMYVL
jgi:hypothetical protein